MSRRSISAYRNTHMHQPCIHYILSWIPPAALQSLTLNLIPHSLPYKLFVCRKQLVMLIPQRSTHLLDSPSFNKKVTIMLLFCATLQTPRCGGEGGGGGGRDGAGGGKERGDMERLEGGGGGGQWVFVKRLSGALRILAERGPLMGDRQA